VVWFLLQSAIILAVVQSNISWHWADHGIQVGIVGVGLAYLATLIVSGQQPVIRGEDKPLQKMTRARKVAVLIAACLAVATTQAWSWDPPRPPASIPAALMPPTVPLLRSAPTPIPPAAPVALMPTPIPPPRPAIPAMMPILPRVALPPVEFDHEYTGKLVVLKEDTYLFIRHVCRDVPNARACSYRTYDSISGATLSCLILLGPDVHENPKVMQHEIGHCNGWPGDHPGAHYD
jgi:hypothetical protein